ncbi:MAG TPA: response regulator [Ktedonobacteraceae bacterium]|nr:response regulator [Ktedonobacteraceae bacterium]
MAKIVFCEDEKMLQKLFRAFLRSTEHEVYIASNGIEGLALIEREHPDLILTDVSMPDLDGFALAAAIRANPILAAIPIIFVTGFAQKQDKEEAARYAPISYLVKPFTRATLRDTIEAVLRRERDEDIPPR